MAQALRVMFNVRNVLCVSGVANTRTRGCRTLVSVATPRDPLRYRFHVAPLLLSRIPHSAKIRRSVYTSTVMQSQRLFTDKHEWVVMDGNIGTIGISDYAQEALGDVVYVLLPEVGAEFQKMDECGALESVKAASELCCPLSGLVTEKNTEVEDTPGLINQSCYDKGWLFKMKVTEEEELEKLMTEDQYLAFLKSQD